MKKIVSFVTVVAIVVLLGIGGYIETHYTIDGTVEKVNGECVTVVDKANYEWDFYGTDYEEGQKVKIYFDTNCTDGTRYDDIITNVKGY